MLNKKEVKGSGLVKGQTVPLTIKRLGINGEGVGFFKRTVVFVPGALPGEEVTAEITTVFPNRAEAKVKRLRKKSNDRIAPPCPVYEECGGCQLQHLSYDGQLREKRDIVIQSFERHAKLGEKDITIKPVIGMEDPWNYRNKSQLQVRKQKGKIIAGLYGTGSHELVELTNCLVQHPETNRVTRQVVSILEDLNISIYNEKKHKGLIRTIVTRVGFETGQIQLVLVTSEENIPRKELLIKEIKKRLPEVRSVVQNVNGKRTSIIFGEKTLVIDGEEVIQESLGDLHFELSARAFFQLNPIQTVKLYDEVKKAAELTGKENIIDAYCGVGTIGLWLADHAKEVRGMDVIKESIDDARKNAKQHGYQTSMRYEVGKAEDLVPSWVKEGFRPDVIVVDPPRTGCDDKLLSTMVKARPDRIVYVSCNPSTLAKDAAFLMKKGYEIKELQPVDMFPQTAHVEVVAVFKKKSN
ncbi:23S rRNA (uracil(1939)-C(5))-methyltransferase RlmD [Pseudalkalibacillus hwajinpoensis]|uniref:23S rRNA (Uracil(1939)-C(5))-methyltransferase RlmD n=1 Tax=Guptibacillus hwajinpoensis TaxID=208199 RepID=A0A4U1MBB4_9BACL|nr:23S rRNA (uracil(1939)-C(5))-methyltransferase RlmD [Pseudalkalibacillus hwajinpoensis]TKD68329.1 23S rRNA (uracil(1939)-C(5))-methyltransferase RlmD [Pseudalkalibacillus hwajinpoensis]